MAERFHVSATTLGSWKARIDEHGPNALLRIPIPVNKFPDLIRYIVRRLKLLCPRLGKVKIAEMLCRAGLHLAPTTVGRFLRAKLRWPEPVAVAVAPGPVVKARCSGPAIFELPRPAWFNAKHAVFKCPISLDRYTCRSLGVQSR